MEVGAPQEQSGGVGEVATTSQLNNKIYLTHYNFKVFWFQVNSMIQYTTIVVFFQYQYSNTKCDKKS